MLPFCVNIQTTIPVKYICLHVIKIDCFKLSIANCAIQWKKPPKWGSSHPLLPSFLWYICVPEGTSGLWFLKTRKNLGLQLAQHSLAHILRDSSTLVFLLHVGKFGLWWPYVVCGCLLRFPRSYITLTELKKSIVYLEHKFYWTFAVRRRITATRPFIYNHSVTFPPSLMLVFLITRRWGPTGKIISVSSTLENRQTTVKDPCPGA